MERVKSIEQLQKGNKIVRVQGGNVEFVEFFCPHHHNEQYSVFLNQNWDGLPKFYNPRLESEKWYLFHDTPEEWDEIIGMRMAQLRKEIENIENYRKNEKMKE